jgi:drug/metabolite transporter (DMT)-like permease
MSPRQRKLLPWIALFVIYVVWGSTYLAIRIVVREVPPMAAASLRFLAAGLVMGALALRVDRGQDRPTPRQIVDYAVIGLLLLAGGNGLVMWAETRISSGVASLVVATVPLWLTFFDGLRPGGKAWTTRVWIGTAVGLLGVALVARPGGAGVAAGHWPAIVGLEGATLAWTAGALYSQSVRRRLPLFTASAVEMLAGSAALLVESRFMGEDLGLFRAASAHAWLGILYLAIFGSLVGFTAFAYCLNELPASTVGTYAYVNPMVAVTLGSVFLGEPLSAGIVGGAALILLAVVLSTTGRAPAASAAPERAAEPAPVPPEVEAEAHSA